MGYFLYPLLICQTAYVAIGFGFVILLIYFIMCTSARSNLRQMGNTDYLTILFSHFLHNVRHTVGNLTGYSCIYFIKYNSGQFHRTGYHRLNGQHDTCNLTTGSYR